MTPAEWLPAFHSSAEDTASPLIPALSSGKDEVSPGLNPFLTARIIASWLAAVGPWRLQCDSPDGEQDPPAQPSVAPS